MKQYLTVLFILLGSIAMAQANGNTNSAPAKVKAKTYSNNMEPAVLEELVVPANSRESEKVLLNKSSKELDVIEVESKTKLRAKKDAKAQKIQLGKASFTKTRSSASHQSYSRSPQPAQQVQMNNVVANYKKNAPNSFEYHYFKYVSGNYNTAWYSHLQKAKKYKPNNLDVATQLAAYHFIMKQESALKTQLELLYKSGKIEKDLLTYGQHLLQGVEKNGVLITHGFDDTYAILYVQKVKKHRTDVKLISLDFIQSQQFKKELGKQGFTIPHTTAIDVAFLSAFCKANKQKNIYLSLTIPKPYLKPLVAQLSVLGLSFKYGSDEVILYGKQRTSLHDRNEKLWNSYKANNMVYAYTYEGVKRLSSNYLPLLYSLKSTYQQRNEKTKLSEIEKAIAKIRVQSKRHK